MVLGYGLKNKMMILTEEEKLLLMETTLDNLKSGGEGVLITEGEYQWILNYLVNNNERYEDCVIFRDNKDNIVGHIGDIY
jgi:hypothetical protein